MKKSSESNQLKLLPIRINSNKRSLPKKETVKIMNLALFPFGTEQNYKF